MDPNYFDPPLPNWHMNSCIHLSVCMLIHVHLLLFYILAGTQLLNGMIAKGGLRRKQNCIYTRQKVMQTGEFFQEIVICKYLCETCEIFWSTPSPRGQKHFDYPCAYRYTHHIINELSLTMAFIFGWPIYSSLIPPRFIIKTILLQYTCPSQTVFDLNCFSFCSLLCNYIEMT